MFTLEPNQILTIAMSDHKTDLFFKKQLVNVLDVPDY